MTLARSLPLLLVVLAAACADPPDAPADNGQSKLAAQSGGEDAPPAQPPATPPPPVDPPPAEPPVVEACLDPGSFPEAGTLEPKKVQGPFTIKPVDVFAEERTVEGKKQLVIALTETKFECSLREHGTIPNVMNELRLVVPGATAAGTYTKDLMIEGEAGQRCRLPDDDTPLVRLSRPHEDVGTPGGGGTAIAGATVQGTVKIKSRTATEVEGTIDVTNGFETLALSFTAPICAGKAPADATCCPINP